MSLDLEPFLATAANDKTSYWAEPGSSFRGALADYVQEQGLVECSEIIRSKAGVDFQPLLPPGALFLDASRWYPGNGRWHPEWGFVDSYVLLYVGTPNSRFRFHTDLMDHRSSARIVNLLREEIENYKSSGG